MDDNEGNLKGGPNSDRPFSGDVTTFRPQSNSPRSVYIHVPFCRHRCGYCNFTLVAGRDYLIERFLKALATEISWLDRTYEIDTLFLGGGTPSHLSPQQLGRLNEILRSRFTLAQGAEVSAECNPNDVNEDRVAALVLLGVNRISLGVQSLEPEKLKRLERDHSAQDVRTAIQIAKNHDVDVSIDLIFAAPGETFRQWQTDLQEAISLAPDHMSTYELTYEKGTRFWNELSRGSVTVSDEDLRADMYSLSIDMLGSAGLKQYEVSSFAADGNQCRHNRAYWSGDPYFAFGPGAARFVDGIRETNHQSTMHYLKSVESGQSPVSDREQLMPLDAAKERLAIGLRIIGGVEESDFQSRTGFSIEAVFGELSAKLIENELLEIRQGVWRLTRKGVMVCDWVAGEIVAEEIED